MKNKIPKLFIKMLAVILLIVSIVLFIASIVFSIYVSYGDEVFEYSFIIKLINEIINN